MVYRVQNKMPLNQTLKTAKRVHGVDPQTLIEKIIRERIYTCKFWTESCEPYEVTSVLNLANNLDHIGGVFSNTKPCPFLCLVLKLLQIQPSLEVVLQQLSSKNRYCSCLFALYLRMVAEPLVIYENLELMLACYSKVKMRKSDGTFYISTVDQFIDSLLQEDRVLDVILPRIQSREVFEEKGQLSPFAFSSSHSKSH